MRPAGRFKHPLPRPNNMVDSVFYLRLGELPCGAAPYVAPHQLMLKARQVLHDYKASDDMWPSKWIPRKRDAAKAKFTEYLELEVGNL